MMCIVNPFSQLHNILSLVHIFDVFNFWPLLRASGVLSSAGTHLICCLQVGTAPSSQQLSRWKWKKNNNNYNFIPCCWVLRARCYICSLSRRICWTVSRSPSRRRRVPVVLTRSPDVEMSVEHVAELRRALSEVGLRHGAQVPAAELLEHDADLR